MWARLRRRGLDLRHLEVDGVRLRVAIRGSGRPLLLLMGIGGNGLAPLIEAPGTYVLDR